MRAIGRSFVFLFLCVPLFFYCSPPEGGPCKADSDCSGGLKCIDNKCQKSDQDGTGQDGGEKEKAPPSCKTDQDCPQERPLCKEGKCAPLPEKCESDDECGPGRRCNTASKKCEKIPCRFDDQCAEGEACLRGDCAKAQKCKTNKDCPSAKTPDGKPVWVCNTCKGVCRLSLQSRACNEDYNCTDIELEWCDKCVHECRKRLKLCEPCIKDKECGAKEDLCLPDQQNPKSGRKYCSRRCIQDTFCAPGFRCFKLDASKYQHPYQCRPATQNCSKPWECQQDSDCLGKGKICDTRQKICVLGCQEDATCPIKDRGSCTTKKDCKNPSATCENGLCRIKMKCCRDRCGVPCASDGDCERNEKCEEGCCRVEGECKTSKDCLPKHYCDQTARMCKPGCLVANDCGLPDPKKNRCRFKCENNTCKEDCTCRNPNLDCAEAIRFCPTPEAQAKDPMAPCRKPIGPVCKPCKGNQECGCQKGDDCRYFCTKKECQQDSDCAGMPNSATKCYNGRCSTKSVCKSNSDCPAAEKCENGYCAENCNNMCVPLQSGARCFTGCDPIGDGTECPSRLSCMEMLPQSASGKKCKGSSKQCTKDADCAAPQDRCGEDGYCTSCVKGKVCRNLNPENPLDLICIPMPATICTSLGSDLCAEGGF